MTQAFDPHRHATARTATGPFPAGLATTHGAGLLAGTRILTLDGELPIEFLAAGDRVVTRKGARTLSDLRIEICDGVSVIRVAAGALGGGRPERPLSIPAEQQVLVRDWRARAMFGTAEALVEVERLVDGDRIARIGTPCKHRIFTLVFDRREIVYAEGVEVASGAEQTVTA